METGEALTKHKFGPFRSNMSAEGRLARATEHVWAAIQLQEGRAKGVPVRLPSPSDAVRQAHPRAVPAKESCRHFLSGLVEAGMTLDAALQGATLVRRGAPGVPAHHRVGWR